MTIAARPTTYLGIPMRSRLEARFAAFLDNAGFDWDYEPGAYASRVGQYLPDFRIRDAGARSDLYVEIKGTVDKAIWQTTHRRMEVILESEPEASLALICDSQIWPGHLDFNVMSIASIGWTRGGVGLCARGQAHFYLKLQDLPITLRRCSDHENRMAELIAYFNPFVP